jgi:GNAT superfamily N-acetyltransferase
MSTLVDLAIRPAQTSDTSAIAALLVQLNHIEQPGWLRGPIEGQRAVMQYTLDYGGRMALHRRYVAVHPDGRIIGTAGMRFSLDPPAGVVPSGTMRMARKQLGVINATRLFAMLLRASFAPETTIPLATAYIHSVVIDHAYRGQGVGMALMHEIERVAVQQGMRGAILRVVVANTQARRAYERLGYTVVDRTPRWMDALIVPTELMRKPLVDSPML